MGFFSETLAKIRSTKAEYDPQDYVDQAKLEAFLRFVSEPYYLTFMKALESRALNDGTGLTEPMAIVKSQGRREAFLEIINECRSLELKARQRTVDGRDDD